MGEKYTRFTTIDWVEDGEAENKARLTRASHGLTWNRIISATQSWAILASAGALIGLVAVIMSITTSFLGDLREGHCGSAGYLNADFCCLGSDGESCAQWHGWPAPYLVYVLLSVLFATIACLIVLQIGPSAGGSGISEIKCIVSGFDMPGFLDFNTLAAKVSALPLTIASGFAVGKEGPSVHYAACIGALVGHHLSAKIRKHQSKRRELITSCCAAGVAVAFGSPIGGVLFAIEEMTSQANVELGMIWRSYFCCLIATSVLSLLDPFRSGQMVLFSVQYDTMWSLFELPFFVLLGIFGGFMGHFIIKWNSRVQRLRKRYWGSYPMQEVVVISLATAALCYWNPFLKVDMTKSMQILFHECEHGYEQHKLCDATQRGSLLFSIAFAFVLRTLLLLISYGAKVPSGIFVPSLAIGALFGRFVGTLVWLMADKFNWCAATGGTTCVNPGSYAFLGAGALLAGVMHITVSVTIIMFELTGAVNYILPSMVVVGVTRLVAANIGDGGIADRAIYNNDYPFLSAEEHSEYGDKTARQIMVPAVTVSVNDGPSYDLDLIDGEFKTYPVVDHNDFLVGSVSRDSPTVNPSPLTVAPDSKLDALHDIFVNLGPRIVFVVEKGKLIGLISRKDFVAIRPPVNVTETTIETKAAKLFARFLKLASR